MTRAALLIEDELVGIGLFDRVPSLNERIVFSAVETGNPWPGRLRGRTFHVAGVTWLVPAAAVPADVRVSLTASSVT
jgi:hypothetical protein